MEFVLPPMEWLLPTSPRGLPPLEPGLATFTPLLPPPPWRLPGGPPVAVAPADYPILPLVYYNQMRATTISEANRNKVIFKLTVMKQAGRW